MTADGTLTIPRAPILREFGEDVLAKIRATAVALGRDRTAQLIAGAVLFINAAFILAHGGRFVAVFLGASREFFLIEHFDLLRVDRDGSLAEWFMYLQTAVCVALLSGIYYRTRQPIYAAWSLVFAFAVADDAFLIHERLGNALATTFGLPALPGLRAVDSGELLIWAAAGILLLGALAWGFARSSHSARTASGALAIAFAVLAFFAVAFDMLHVVLVDPGTPVYLIFAVIEDGGEMLAIGLALTIALVLYRHPVIARGPGAFQETASPG